MYPNKWIFWNFVGRFPKNAKEIKQYIESGGEHAEEMARVLKMTFDEKVSEHGVPTPLYEHILIFGKEV